MDEGVKFRKVGGGGLSGEGGRRGGGRRKTKDRSTRKQRLSRSQRADFRFKQLVESLLKDDPKEVEENQT